MNADVARRNDKPAVELWLELETRCNLRCPFCYNFWKDGRQTEPSRQTAAATIGALRRLLEAVDCRQLALSGGEPLLLPYLDELLAALKPYSIPTVLTSNGVLLNKNKVWKLLDQGIAHFQVPLHSHLDHVHNELSGGRNCWEHSLSALASVRECGGDSTCVYVATRKNLAHFNAVVEICAALDVRTVIFNRFIPTGLGSIHAATLGAPTEPELWDALGEADFRAERHGIAIQLGVPIHAPSLARKWHSIRWASCPVRVGQRRWTIGADLNIRRCNHSADAIGNLLENGVERLLEELERAAPGQCDSGRHPCQFIEPRHPVDVRARLSTHASGSSISGSPG